MQEQRRGMLRAAPPPDVGRLQNRALLPYARREPGPPGVPLHTLTSVFTDVIRNSSTKQQKILKNYLRDSNISPRSCGLPRLSIFGLIMIRIHLYISFERSQLPLRSSINKIHLKMKL